MYEKNIMTDKELKDIQEKLYNMEIDLPKNDWQALESRLPQKQKRILPLWVRYAAAAVFVFACFSTVLMFVNQENQLHNTQFANHQEEITTKHKSTETKLPKLSTPLEKQATEKEIHKNTHKEPTKCSDVESNVLLKEHETVVNPSKKEVQQTLRASTTQTSQTDLKTRPITPKLQAYSLVATLPSHFDAHPNTYKKDLTTQEAEALMRRIHDATILPDYVPELKYDNQLTRSSKWNLDVLASVTTDSKSSLYQSRVNTLSQKNHLMMVAPEAEQKVTHDLPISFAVNISKQMVKGLYLKTGLQYTNLHSEYRTKLLFSEEFCDQYLQYVGIPVEVSYHFIEKKYFYSYFGANVMLEKGISQYKKKYSKDSHGNRLNLSNSYTNEIKGFQWSIGMNCGLGFNITKNIGIFAQPSVNWYLENNLYPQPESIRTKNPYTFNIVAGIQFNLN